MTLLKLRDGSSIAYDLVGSGPSMVFMHGGTYNRRMWMPVIEKLRDSYTCLNVDLPGHGESSDPISYDSQLLMGNLHEFIQKFNFEKPFMIGHSISGIIAALYASMYPVSGLVTSDQQLDTRDFIARLQSMREQLQSPAFPKIWRMIESQLRIDLIPEERRGLVQGVNSNPRQDVMLGFWRDALNVPPAQMQEQMDQAARRIKCPFTAVFGEDVGQDYRDWLGKHVPQCKAVVFRNAGHFPHLVDPIRFAEEVRALAQKAAQEDNEQAK
jgi:3-oxoadipate enol-lactonase